MRNPEITKKTSTPTNPPGTTPIPAWYATTSRIATARRPSTSGRNDRPPSRAVSAGSGRSTSPAAGWPRVARRSTALALLGGHDGFRLVRTVQLVGHSTVVRWKFRYDRDGVGPRWPW